MKLNFCLSPSACFLVACLHISVWKHCTSCVAYAYTSEQMPQQPRGAQLGNHDDRPLNPPFPNGSCSGTVITIPRKDLFPGQVDNENPFNFNLNIDPFSSLGNVMLPPRDVKVWLPKEYHNPEYRFENFPVLYCHDGQNAIDDKSSWTGSSWRLTGALTRLHERGMLRVPTPPIVVCIPCGEGDFLVPGVSRRHSEYGDYTHPVSQAHGQFVATNLHPYIMSRFRVKDGPEHISTIGSSLGGQASLQLVLRYPELFGGAACLSPAFQPATIAAAMLAVGVSRSDQYNALPKQKQKNAKGQSKRNPNSLHSKTIYLDNGGDVDDTRVPVFDALDHFTMNERWWNPGYWWLDTSLQPMVDAMRWTLDQGGVQYTYEKIPGGRHNERAWAQRIHLPLLALYGKK